MSRWYGMSPTPSRCYHTPMSARGLFRLALALLASATVIACDRPDPTPAPTSAPATRAADADDHTPLDPAGLAVPDAATPSASSTVPAGHLLIEGRTLPLPTARLTLGRQGAVLLLADTPSSSPDAPANPDSGNSVMFSFTPTTDGETPWRRAVWKFQLTSSEEETTDGIYLGGPEHHLRPVEMEIEVTRDEAAQTGTARIHGFFVRSDVEDPLKADRYAVDGELPVALLAAPAAAAPVERAPKRP